MVRFHNRQYSLDERRYYCAIISVLFTALRDLDCAATTKDVKPRILSGLFSLERKQILLTEEFFLKKKRREKR